MLKRFVFFLLFSTGSFAFSQNLDSITLVKAKWEKQKVAPKTRLFTHHFNEKNLFLANQNISYVEIKRRGNAPTFALGAEEKVLKNTQDFGKESNSLVAINGTFFDVKNGGS